MSQMLLPLGLAFIMFAMGLTLTVKDFTSVVVHPASVLLGLLVQIVLLPLAAFSLLLVWPFLLRPMEPALAVGIMILAASPGGITSNMLTDLARGDTALSISLTAISSLMGMVTIPLIVGFSLSWFMSDIAARDLGVGGLVLKVFMVSTLPLLLGMAVHHFASRNASRLDRLVRPVSVGVFALIVLWAFASSWEVMKANIMVIGPLMLLLNIGIMGLAYALAKTIGRSRPQAVAISLEGGLQNGAIGIFVAMTLLQNSDMMIPSITYALLMNLSAAVFIVARVRSNSTANRPA